MEGIKVMGLCYHPENVGSFGQSKLRSMNEGMEMEREVSLF